MRKRWTPEEIALACKAYVAATNNPIEGADQDLHSFSYDLIEKYKVLSPSHCIDGTYYHRGDSVYKYLRDNMFPSIQKFQNVLLIVKSSNPSGTTE